MINSDILDRATTRLGDVPGSLSAHYNRAEILVAVNQVYRLMCFLTMALETTVTFTMTSGDSFQKMLSTYPDWILPLRIRVGGVKLLPARAEDLAALNSSWSTTAGTPERYALLGFDLLCIYKQPMTDTASQIVYARTPALLADDGNEPELQEEYHQSLIDGAVPFLRIKEGAQEWQKTLPSWDRYMDACKKLGDYVRARNREQGYDYAPVELMRFDRSKVMGVANG